MKCLYTPFDVAVYFKTENLTINEEHSILESLWGRRNDLMEIGHIKEKIQFVSSVMIELYKLGGITECAEEINIILREMGSKYRVNESEFERDVIESYFKVIKLRLMYTPGKDYCRIKLRTLIGSFGYKRRTAALVEYINTTINSLGVKTFLRNWEQCNIGEISLDKTIVIRL